MPRQEVFSYTVSGRWFAAIRVLALGFFLAASGLLPGAAGAASLPSSKAANTRINAEKMTYDSERNVVVFEGNVHVTRPDIQIWSELLSVYLDNSGKPASSGNTNMGMQGGKADRIIAERNVRIKQDNKQGSCGKATYFVPQGRIMMEQSPVIVDGDNRIRGRVINYFTETGRSEVVGDVDVQFTTDDAKLPSQPGTAPSGAGRAAGQAVSPAAAQPGGQRQAAQ